MSFTRLPTELKMHLIKLSHEMRLEETRQDLGGHQISVFNGGFRDGPAVRSKATRKKVLEGSVIERLSLVNHELRSIAIPYLFEVSLFIDSSPSYCASAAETTRPQTLRVSRVGSDFFKTGILTSRQLCQAVTHLAFDFDDYSLLDPDAFAHLLLSVCPALPNLSRVSGLHNNMIYNLLDHNKLTTPIRPSLLLSPSRIQALRDAFGHFAARISEWDVWLELDNLDAIVAANPTGLRRLTLSTPCSRLFPYTDIIDAMSCLTSLTTLSMRQDIDGNVRRYRDSEMPFVTFFDKAAHSVQLSFRDTLRSLSVETDTDHHTDAPTTSILHFASTFPNLEHLVLPTDILYDDDFESDLPTTPFHLRKLVHLEILKLAAPNAKEFVYPRLKMPLLTTLTLGIAGYQQRSLEHMLHHLVTTLSTLPRTLETLQLTSPGNGLPELWVDEIVKKISINVQCLWNRNEVEFNHSRSLPVDSEEWEDDDESGEGSEGESSDLDDSLSS